MAWAMLGWASRCIMLACPLQVKSWVLGLRRRLGSPGS
ncbi:hypothetical protein GLYMA_02G267001v4 [Glycine max]|nr:hypothetical protein GLYMA_02G267001v4 [Glycine max]KAH1062245.1 hypothetical protein GYH30_005315 [Glycine max]